MTDLIWESPPPRNHSGGRKPQWDGILQPLMEKPGVWARVKEFEKAKLANSCVQNLRRRIVKVPPGEWLFISRGLKVYACYVEGLPPEELQKVKREI